MKCWQPHCCECKASDTDDVEQRCRSERRGMAGVYAAADQQSHRNTGTCGRADDHAGNSLGKTGINPR